MHIFGRSILICLHAEFLMPTFGNLRSCHKVKSGIAERAEDHYYLSRSSSDLVIPNVLF